MASTVLFVCPHGAGKSRIAAAWFQACAPPGWTATSAGLQPQAMVSVHAPRLLAGTPAAEFLDHELPRPLPVTIEADLVVAIDSPPGAVPGAIPWSLLRDGFDEAMAEEIRERVAALVGSLPAVAAGTPGGPA